jgi:hypothetical protein
MLTPTFTRVPQHTNQEVNKRIRSVTEWNIAVYANSQKADIGKRIQELDREWDIERLLETNAALFSLAGLTLGLSGSRKWFLLPAVVSGFLLQHALQGWCPPVSLFRRLGIRTAAEIDAERYALKLLRGDFGEVVRERTKGTHAVYEAALR